MQTRSGEQIESSTEKLLRDLKAVVHDGEDLLRAGARDLSERGVAAKERLAAALEVAKETQQKLQQQVMSGAKATDRVIRDHPYESLGLAFGVGILLGMWARR
jgi:ElaB/YqjD/DUF883 family membrane-anchored ribosome-binding protein